MIIMECEVLTILVFHGSLSSRLMNLRGGGRDVIGGLK
jgi:hypothetical protein